METFCFGTFSDKLKNHKLKYNVKLNLVCPKKVLFYYFSSLILQKKVIFLEKGKNKSLGINLNFLFLKKFNN